MSSFIIRTTLIAAALAAAIASPAAAQTPPLSPGLTELAVGGSLLRDFESDRTMAGWIADAGLRVYRPWWVIAEASGHYKRLAPDHRVRVHAYMGGLRFAKETDSGVRPFAQLVLGVACSCGSGVTNASTKDFAIQPGAGLDVSMSDRLWLRLQADYRSVRADGDSFGQMRFSAGGVFFFGRTQ